MLPQRFSEKMGELLQFAFPVRLRPDEAAWGRRDFFFEIRLSRNLSIGIFLSILVHAFFLFGLHQKISLNPPLRGKSGSLDVELIPVERPHSAETVRAPREERRVGRAVRAPERRAIAVPVPKPLGESVPAPKMSFLDAVNAARASRDAAAKDYPVKPQAMGPLPDGGPDRQPPGTSGIFRILRMDDSSAEFSFLGWHSEFSNSHKEVFDVDAGPGGDVRLAVVRKMIEIIRRYYKGDFNWDSERLGGVVVLSARLKDEKELEAFMMKEFFGTS